MLKKILYSSILIIPTIASAYEVGMEGTDRFHVSGDLNPSKENFIFFSVGSIEAKVESSDFDDWINQIGVQYYSIKSIPILHKDIFTKKNEFSKYIYGYNIDFNYNFKEHPNGDLKIPNLDLNLILGSHLSMLYILFGSGLSFGYSDIKTYNPEEEYKEFIYGGNIFASLIIKLPNNLALNLKLKYGIFKDAEGSELKRSDYNLALGYSF